MCAHRITKGMVSLMKACIPRIYSTSHAKNPCFSHTCFPVMKDREVAQKRYPSFRIPVDHVDQDQH